jgi:HJR/Mrr/RecB family endonuclease
MQTLARVTARDVVESETEIARWKTEWERYDCRVVSETEIAEANYYMSQAVVEIQSLTGLKHNLADVRLFSLRVIQKALSFLGLSELPWFVSSLLLATPFCAVSAALLVLVAGNVIWVVAGTVIAYILSVAAIALCLYPVSNGDLEQQIEMLTRSRNARVDTLRVVEERLESWRDRHRQLLLVQEVQRRYEAACRKHQEVTQLLQSRRYQLLHTDWRSLRGVPFEDFLANVFDELGYVVTKTKTTGDQGVDLILIGKGRKIAVQAKGYTEAVGNKSVQEVFAGMTYYKCDACVTVTNSTFTKGAIDLAGSVNCRLIDSSKIPDLIQGHILL